MPTGVLRTFLPARVPRGVLRAPGALVFGISIVAPFGGTVFGMVAANQEFLTAGHACITVPVRESKEIARLAIGVDLL